MTSEINLYLNCDIKKVLPKIVEGIFLQKKHAYILCENNQKQHEIDRLLWSYSQTSFIPHGTIEDDYISLQPILIGDDPYHKNDAKILLCIYLVKKSFLDELLLLHKYEKILLFNNDEFNDENLLKFYNINIIKQDESGKWIKGSLQSKEMN